VKSLSLFLILFVLPTLLLTAQSHPVPPARREIQKYESTHPDEPAQRVPARIDPAQLQHEAEELVNLANSIPPDMARISQGMLPKDVLGKLARIEKISKRLRGELSR
jgi:hypothetical protein